MTLHFGLVGAGSLDFELAVATSFDLEGVTVPSLALVAATELSFFGGLRFLGSFAFDTDFGTTFTSLGFSVGVSAGVSGVFVGWR